MGTDFLCGLVGGGGGSLMGALDPGAIVHKALDSILPPELQFLSGVAGAITDYECGNPMGAIKEGMSVLSDLQDVSQQRQAGASGASSAPAWTHEPDPPPTTLASQRGAQFMSHANAAFAAPDPAPAPASSGWRGSPPPAQQPSTLQATPPAAESSGWRPTPTTSTLRATPPATPPPQDHGSQVASFVKTLFDATPAGLLVNALQGTKPAADPSKMTKDQFMNLSDKDFMNAVTDGKIPKEVSDDPAAMLSLQKRMQHIMEMNQLMTQMLQAIHQMRSSIIQNVRA